MKDALAIAVAAVALSGCGRSSVDSAATTTTPTTTTLAPSSQAARLKTCNYTLDSTLDGITGQARTALDKDAEAAYEDFRDIVRNMEPPSSFNPAFDNYRAVVVEAKTKLSSVRDRCRQQVPECPNAGSTTFAFLEKYFDDSLQQLIESFGGGSSTTVTMPAPPSYPPVTCD